MAEEKDPQKEGKLIASKYITKLGWAREMRSNMGFKITSDWTPEKMDETYRKVDNLEEETETEFSKTITALKQRNDNISKETLHVIFNILEKRHDLGFFGKKIIDRMRETFRP